MIDLADLDAPVDVPLVPAKEWFEQAPRMEGAPDWVKDFDPRDGLIQIRFDGPEAGRVVALVAPEGENILRDGFPWQPPQSPTNYEFAHTGTTLCNDGTSVRTANIGGNINHAPGNWGMAAAVDLYANTASRTLRCRYHDVPGVGVVAVGALWPGVTKRDAITAMGMAISGDWRHVPSLGEGVRDLAGSQLVNAPALRPLPHGVKRSETWKPLRFRPVMAGLSGSEDDVVFGEWVVDDVPMLAPAGRTIGVPSVAAVAVAGPSFEQRLRRVEEVMGVLIADEIADERIEAADGDDDDYSDLITEVFGCKACRGGDPTGCPACGGTGVEPYDPAADIGFDMADEFADDHEAMVAALSGDDQ